MSLFVLHRLVGLLMTLGKYERKQNLTNSKFWSVYNYELIYIYIDYRMQILHIIILYVYRWSSLWNKRGAMDFWQD